MKSSAVSGAASTLLTYPFRASDRNPDQDTRAPHALERYRNALILEQVLLGLDVDEPAEGIEGLKERVARLTELSAIVEQQRRSRVGALVLNPVIQEQD